MKISIGQPFIKTGDIISNVEAIIKCIRQAIAEKANVLLLPETAITGYCCGALFDNIHFIRENITALKQYIVTATNDNDLVIIIGFVDYHGAELDGSLNISNSVAVIQHGEIIGTYKKQLLANANHHEDKKYFIPGTSSEVFDIIINDEKVTIGVPICEDIWECDHVRDIVNEMVRMGARIIFVPNFSYFFYGKHEKRFNLLQKHAIEKGVPIIYCNAVGVGDIVKNIMIFDGGSMAISPNKRFSEGKRKISQLKRFESDFKTFDVNLSVFSDTYYDDSEPINKYNEIFDALVFEQSELFKLLRLEKAQVHISGGIDSAIVAALCVAAMGKDNCIFVTNPTKDNKARSVSLAIEIADKLGVKLYWNHGEEINKLIISEHEKAFGVEPPLSGKSSIQAVLRTVQGLATSHTFKTGIVAAGNHTEIVEGWASFHDIGSIGVHSLIGDLTKLELYEFAKFINSWFKKEVIPHVLYDGTVKPAAELADADEDPLDYYVRSGICAMLIRDKSAPTDIIRLFVLKQLPEDYFTPYPDGKTVYDVYTTDGFIDQVKQCYNNSKRSVYKTAQSAPTVIISPRSRGFSSRETILNFWSPSFSLSRVYIKQPIHPH